MALGRMADSKKNACEGLKIITEDELQEVIHENLVLLEISGHNIDFQKGMFQKNNITGFESVGYALLMIIDSKECKRSIPWPLLDDRSLRSEFRTKFIIFIKMINKKYPEARIPELTSSTLHFPGGMKFLRFMHKLTSFVVELKLREILGKSDASEKLLPRYQHSKNYRDNTAKINILTGARYDTERKSMKFKDLVPKSLLVECYKQEGMLADRLESVQLNIRSELSLLHFDQNTIANLLDGSCYDPIREWNRTTNTKIKQLNKIGNTLKRMQNLSNETCQQLREMMADQDSSNSSLPFFEPLCLDGNKLLPSFQSAGEIKSNNGVLSLESLIHACREEIRQLCLNTSESIPLLPQAQTLLQKLTLVHTTTEEKTAWMDKLCVECDQTIMKLRSSLYEMYDGGFCEEGQLSDGLVHPTNDALSKENADKVREKVLLKMVEMRSINKPSQSMLRRSGSIESFMTPNNKGRSGHQSCSFDKPKFHRFTPFSLGKKKHTEDVFTGNSPFQKNKGRSKLRKSISLTSLKGEEMDIKLISEETLPYNSVAVSPKSLDEPYILSTNQPPVNSQNYLECPTTSTQCEYKSSQLRNNSFGEWPNSTEEDNNSSEVIKSSYEAEKNEKRKSLDKLVARYNKLKQSMKISNESMPK